MAMTTCKECGHEVSSMASACPHCGIKNPGVRTKDMVAAAVILAVVALGAIAYAFSGDDNKAPSTTSTQAATGAVGADDVQAYAKFHKSMVIFERPMDEASKDFDQATAAAVKENNVYGLYDATKTYHDVLFSLSDHLFNGEVKSPSLQSTQAKNDADAAIEALKTNVNLRMVATQTFMDAIDAGDFKPSSVSTIREANESADVQAMQEAIAITKGYSDLGIDIKQVDTTNGGLLTKAAK